MRALLINPEFPLSFWSFPKSIALRGSKATLPPLGLLTVAALLPQDWEMRLADLNTRILTDEELQWADIVLLSAMYIQKDGLLALVKEAKQRGKIVVAGGPYCSSIPEDALNVGCDYVVRGEGENTIPLLLDAIKEGKKGIIEHPEKPSITDSPIPRYDLLELDDYDSLTIQTSRGCPFNCEFCDVVNLYGRKMRYKNPEQVVKELETLYRFGGSGEVFICDDNFIGSRKHALAVTSAMIKWSASRGKPFTFMTQTSVNLGQDIELIDLMTEANLGRVFIGIESPDEDVLEATHKYQNVKNPLVESINFLKKNGMTVIGSFVIGFDGEKKGAAERISAFIEKTDLPMVMIGLLQAPPNTNLWKRMDNEGRLRADAEHFGGTFCTFNFVPSRPEKELLEEYVEAWNHLYEPRHYLERSFRYYMSMRPTRRALALANGEQPPDIAIPKPRISFYKRIVEILAFLRILWWQGIRPPYRVQFWRQLFVMQRRNPSRFRSYLSACAMGEDLFDMKRIIRERITTIINQLELESKA